jgi:hypothetical protein
MMTEERSHVGWTDEEKARLEEVRTSGKTVKACMHLFPGRSLCAVKQKISNMKEKKPRGHYSWVWDAIERELTATPGLTGRQLATKTGCCHRQIMDRLYEHNAPEGKTVYVSNWVRANPENPGPGPWVQCWTLGSEPDTPRPARMNADDRRKRDRMSYRKTAKKANPFAVAAGAVPVPKAAQGRVIKHLHDNEFEEAA